jgi:hypothetical protein
LHIKFIIMKSINILKILINILFVVLNVILVLGFLLFIAVLFFNENLPFFLQGYKMLITSFDWNLSLVPISTVVNFVLFTLAIYYLKKCIQPFIESDFYSTLVISNLNKTGNLFVFIGGSTIIIRILSVLYFQSLIPTEGYSGFKIAGLLTSSLDITVLFLIIIGLFFLLFSNAFLNAKEFKQDSDLTI